MTDQTAYWDSVAGSKQFTIAFDPAFFQSHFQSDAAILDFGCGYGRTLLELAALGFHRLAGCDCSGEMLKLAGRALPQAELRQNTGGNIPFPDASFDVVLLLAVLTAIPEDATQAQLMAEIDRVLKPGGMLYLSDFLLNDDERNRARYAAGGEPYGVFTLPDGARLRHHRLDYLLALTSRFRCSAPELTTHRTMNGHTSNGVRLAGRKID